MSADSAGGGAFNDNKIFLQPIYDKDKVLLLYNGADLHVLEKIPPQDTVTARVHVLVTTRTTGDHPVLARPHGITSLGQLEPDAAVEALQAWHGHADKRLDEVEMKFARQAVSQRFIEGLPIAITHVATFMKMVEVSCQQYFQLFKDQQAELKTLALDMNKLLHYF